MGYNRRTIEMTKNNGWIHGAILATITMAIFLLLFSLLLIKKDLTDSFVTYMSFFVLGAGSFVGGYGYSCKKGTEGIKNGAFIGGGIFLFMVISGGIVHGLQFSTISLTKGAVCVLYGVSK
mgnify:CR=1 FL=1